MLFCLVIIEQNSIHSGISSMSLGATFHNREPRIISAQSETVTLELMPRAEPYVVGIAITTVDTDGVESVRSDVVSKTCNIDIQKGSMGILSSFGFANLRDSLIKKCPIREPRQRIVESQ